MIPEEAKKDMQGRQRFLQALSEQEQEQEKVPTVREERAARCYTATGL